MEYSKAAKGEGAERSSGCVLLVQGVSKLAKKCANEF